MTGVPSGFGRWWFLFIQVGSLPFPATIDIFDERFLESDMKFLFLFFCFHVKGGREAVSSESSVLVLLTGAEVQEGEFCSILF